MNNTLSDIIRSGMNNPDCSFWVGMAAGNMSATKILLIFIGAGMGYKLFELIFDKSRKLRENNQK